MCNGERQICERGHSQGLAGEAAAAAVVADAEGLARALGPLVAPCPCLHMIWNQTEGQAITASVA